MLDENIDHGAFHPLDDYGHDVEHVDFVPELGGWTANHPIAPCSLDNDRVLVTYDDDFVLDVVGGERRAAFYLDDATLSV